MTRRSKFKVFLPGLAACLAGLLTGGCQGGYRVEFAARPQVSPWAHRPHLATICILRPQSFGALATFMHFDNGRFVGATRGARVFFCYLAQPGLHQLVARSDNDAVLTLETAAGGRYFARLEVRFGPDGLTHVGESYARRWVSRLRYVVTYPDRKGAIPPYRLPVPAMNSPEGPVTAANFQSSDRLVSPCFTRRLSPLARREEGEYRAYSTDEQQRRRAQGQATRE